MLYLMVGISGAGKTSVVKRHILPAEDWRPWDNIASADFEMMQGDVYAFDPKRVEAAHKRCVRSATARMAQVPKFVVDNTNTRDIDIAVYIGYARAFDVPFQLVYVPADPIVAAARTAHSVPAWKIVQQHAWLQSAMAQWPMECLKNMVVLTAQT